MRKVLLMPALAGGLLLSAQSAGAHGDFLDGPEANINEGVVFAQAAGAGAAEASPRVFDIPEGMKIEHDQLHADLVELTQAGGRTGEAAKAVAEVLDPHFAKENEYALPPLSLLVPLSQGEFEADMAGVLKMTDRLEAEMPTMHSEHEEIATALKELKEAATAENKPAGVQFAEELSAHAQEEEEVLYPASLLIGRYVKLKLAQ